ncbi:Lipoyl synthase, partial [Frankliniella fusca]
MFVGAVECGDELHIIFKTNIVVERLLQNQQPNAPGVQLHLDGSFKTLPKFFVQLLLLAAAFRDNVFSAYMVLMTRRKTADYTAVFRYLAEKHPDLKIESFMMDFESAMRRGVAAVWPEPPQHGCWSHYTRRIDLYTSRTPLRALKAVENTMQLFRMIGCLPLLPADLMLRGLQEVIRPDVEQLDLTRAQAAGMQALLNHVQTYWLGRIGVDVLSVSGLRRRTNNDVESWNGTLTRTAQKTHLNVWEFIDTLRKVEGRDATDFERVYKNDLQVRRSASVASKESDRQIRKATVKLHDSEKTTDDIRRFLTHMAFRNQRIISPATAFIADEREPEERDADDVAWEEALAEAEALTERQDAEQHQDGVRREVPVQAQQVQQAVLTRV